MPYKDPAKERERQRRRSLKNKQKALLDDEFREKLRLEWKNRKRAQRERRRDEINQIQRQYYRNNAEHIKKLTRDGRRRRNPTVGLASLIRDVRSGRKPARDLIDKLSTATIELSALIHGESGKGLPTK